jgi:hypothetical protein
LDLLHHFDHFLGWKPFVVAGLQHFRTDVTLFIDVGVVNIGFEGNNWSLEGEVVQLELNLELTSVEWSLLRTCNVDLPQGVAFLDNVESSEIESIITLSQALLSPFSVWEVTFQ